MKEFKIQEKHKEMQIQYSKLFTSRNRKQMYAIT